MFKKAVEAVIADGIRNLGMLSKAVNDKVDEAQKEVQRCKDEMQGLVTLAKEVPEKVFDRYSNVLTSVIDLKEEASQGHSIRLNYSYENALHGIMGDEKLKAGKYRVIVLLEPLK